MLRPIVSALLAASVSVQQASASPRSIPSQTFPSAFGVNIHFVNGHGDEVKLLSKAYRVARMDFAWDRIERVRGKYRFADYDGLVRDLEANRVTPLFILDYGNSLYGPGPVRTAQQRKAYAAFCAAAVKHYRGHRIMWEYWNEPNGTGFWGDRPDPDEYAAMVNEAGPALRKADPEATVLLGAFSGFPWDYIETVFRHGCLRWADAVTVHPYRSSYPETAGSDYLHLRHLIAQNAPNRSIPIISGEWGYSTNRKNGISELRQAQYLIRQRLYNVRCGVLTSIWYDWKDDGPNPDENEHRFGSTRRDTSPKPAFTAALTMSRTLAGFSFVRMLEDGPTDYVMLLRNAKGESAVAFWTTGPDRNYRLPAVPKRAVSMLGASLLSAREMAIGPSPSYALFGRNDSLDTLASWTFLKPDTALRAGKPMTARFTYRNAGKADRRVRAAFQVEGGAATPREVNLVLKAGRQMNVPVKLDVWTRTPRTAVTVMLTVDGREDKSVIPVAIVNPITVGVNGVEEGKVTVTLDTSGESARETFMVRQTDAAGKPVGVMTPVEIRPGATSCSVRVPYVSGGHAPVYGAVVLDRQGRVAAAAPPMGFLPILGLEGVPAGSVPRSLTVHAEGDEKPGGSASLIVADVPEHGHVVDMRAEFPDGWRYFVVSPRETAIPDNAVAVGMWVNGDASGDVIRARILDAEGQCYQPTFGSVTWKGWRWITARLDDPTVGSWGGPQDGIIHRPIRWDSVFLLDSGSRKAHAAHIQFGTVTLMTR